MHVGELIKVRFFLPNGQWHGLTSEGIWTTVTLILVDRFIAEVKNVPFFTKSVSFQDKVAVTISGEEAIFISAIERGGHSTYRVFFEGEVKSAEKHLDKLKEAGCDWEMSEFRGGLLYAIDVPVAADIYKVYHVLVSGKSEGVWLFQEGYVGHKFNDDSLPSIS